MKPIPSSSTPSGPPHGPKTPHSCALSRLGHEFIPKGIGSRTVRALQVLLLTSLAAVAAEPDWQWREDPGKSLELRRGEVLVARFLVNPRPARPHFDVLATPDGRIRSLDPNRSSRFVHIP